ncbi:hypothetical protein ACFXKF_32935 [Streptomyces scopuliridis]|uniref:hypothetical protein n=1 Tax=Streptomyces scopuliridis TaxID=452529 RepID=UPI0036B2D657
MLPSLYDTAPPAAASSPRLDADVVLSVGRNAVDVSRFPGYTAFTSGVVHLEADLADRVTLRTDNRWAASAIRRALLDAGHAVEGDIAHEAVTVVVHAISHDSSWPVPALPVVEHFDAYERSTYRIDGPDGTIEQQCGYGGHNDLIVHSDHPFPSSVRVPCNWHGSACWMRSRWPHRSGARHLIRSVFLVTGPVWELSEDAERRLRDVYALHVHQTRPLSGPSSSSR